MIFFLCLIHALCSGRGTQKLFFIEKSFVRSLESDFLSIVFGKKSLYTVINLH